MYGAYAKVKPLFYLPSTILPAVRFCFFMSAQYGSWVRGSISPTRFLHELCSLIYGVIIIIIPISDSVISFFGIVCPSGPLVMWLGRVLWLPYCLEIPLPFISLLFIHLFILIFFLLFWTHSVRTDGVRSPDESVSEGKYLPLFFLWRGRGV